MAIDRLPESMAFELHLLKHLGVLSSDEVRLPLVPASDAARKALLEALAPF